MTASESVLGSFKDAKDRPKVGRWSWRRIEIVIEGQQDSIITGAELQNTLTSSA